MRLLWNNARRWTRLLRAWGDCDRGQTVKVGLTPKQQRFVAEYLVDLNATQAAIRAGYSAKTAVKIGSENLRKPDVAAAIASKQAKRADRVEISADRVLREVARIAFGDIRALYRADGGLKKIDELDDDAAAMLAGVDEVEMQGGAAIGGEEGVAHVPMYTKKVKLWDKPAALEKLMKHLGLYQLDNEQGINTAVAMFAEMRAVALGTGVKPVDNPPTHHQ